MIGFKHFVTLFIVSCSGHPNPVPSQPIQMQSPIVNEVVNPLPSETSPRVNWSLVTTDGLDTIVTTSPCRLTYLRHLSSEPIAEEALVECKMSDSLVGTLKTHCLRDGKDRRSVTVLVFTLSVTLSCWSE